MLDSEEELEKILTETGGAKDLTLIVRFAVSGEGAAYPLVHKFGVSAGRSAARCCAAPVRPPKS